MTPCGAAREYCTAEFLSTRSVSGDELDINRIRTASVAFSYCLGVTCAKGCKDVTRTFADPEYAEVIEQLTAQVDAFFDMHSSDRWNLWQGGRVKSNSGRPFLWLDAWGEDWKPEFWVVALLGELY